MTHFAYRRGAVVVLSGRLRGQRLRTCWRERRGLIIHRARNRPATGSTQRRSARKARITPGRYASRPAKSCSWEGLMADPPTLSQQPICSRPTCTLMAPRVADAIGVGRTILDTARIPEYGGRVERAKCARSFAATGDDGALRGWGFGAGRLDPRRVGICDDGARLPRAASRSGGRTSAGTCQPAPR
jgi:hypothetical protein